jgi:hypothetical protein
MWQWMLQPEGLLVVIHTHRTLQMRSLCISDVLSLCSLRVENHVSFGPGQLGSVARQLCAKLDGKSLTDKESLATH